MNDRRIFKRLTVTYILILLSVVFVLEVCFGLLFVNISRNVDNDDLARSNEEAFTFFSGCESAAKGLKNSLYQDRNMITDVTWYLSLTSEEYLTKQLENYASSTGVTMKGTASFAENALLRNPSISGITFVSFKNNVASCFGPDGTNHNVKRLDSYEYETFSSSESRSIDYTMKLQDPESFEELGAIVISFYTDELGEIEKRYPKIMMMVLGLNDDTIYSTAGALGNRLYNIADAHSISKAKGSFSVISYILSENYARIPLYGYIVCIFVGIMGLLIGSLIVVRRIRLLSVRLGNILDAMDRAMNGDLNIKLETTGRSDELDIVSDYFNQMCSSLDNYIQQSYILALEQKNAELKALQNQINPHFLYNTLEAIRMQAVCNGDREVGDMLYNLAVLFRGQIKDSFEIPIEREMDYCKKYIELLKVRFSNKFTYEIDLPEELKNVSIIKISLQPIVENYFVHGIRMSDKDNLLKITVRRTDENEVSISIADNGTGMDKTTQKKEGSNSVGLANVQRRLEAAYGKNYGIEWTDNKPHGLIVTLRIPYTR